MTKPDDPNPNATIQLGAANADDVQLIEGDAAENASSEADLPAAENTSPRTAPPPLPPEASMPPPVKPPSVQPPAPPKPRQRPIVIAGIFLVLLAVAITIGVKVGSSLRAGGGVASVRPPAAPSVSASAAARPTTITMPVIEMTDEPPDAH